MVFTNRFGKNSLTNIAFMFAQMVCLLLSSRAITEDWSTHFIWFIFPMAVISVLLLLQYMIVYSTSHKDADRRLIWQFFIVLGLRSTALLFASFLPYQYGLPLAVGGIRITWILPGLLTRSFSGKIEEGLTLIRFPHLIERLTLLVIITFGEMIIGIVPYFSSANFSVTSLVVFLVVISLFMIYIIEMDHLIETKRSGITGNAAIYLHYLIFFGLSFVTTALGLFLEDTEQLATQLLYGGIVLLIIGIMGHLPYNKPQYRLNKSQLAMMAGCLGLGYLVSSVGQLDGRGVLMVTSLVLISIFTLLARFYIKQGQLRER